MKFTISKDRSQLILTASQHDRRVLRALGEAIHRDATMHDFLEPLTCNSELEWIRPEETGDLTAAPMLGILGEEGDKDRTVFLENHGLRITGGDDGRTLAQPILERWGWENYQVLSLLGALKETGEAILSNRW